ncbi:hypothetical protein FB567DRAFT_230477 [Paraphoma chrysanthemicola]|uniref:Uncharacterized protein n=1 Tax=Paraphoma chrysanthemicola TaxID=798071 RepID=A0A8K0RD63_9PLEO|nr:hypothetical protein FB567DRAFT_230477 [Paraphoma chrysanthemicola]
MPRLVARQCGILRGAQAAIGTPWPSQRPAALSVVARPRSYETRRRTVDHAPTRKHKKIRPLNSAIIIPSSVAHTQPADIINHITPVSHENVHRDTFCVFLVTPSFASWLVEDDTFVARAIQRAYSNSATTPSERISVHALCAVVDSLPAGRSIRIGQKLDDVVLQRCVEPPVGETGFEGVAYATLPANSSIPSTSPRSSEKGAIDFVFAGHTREMHVYRDTWRLPLATTVFQTGSPTTMLLSKWDLESGRGEPTLESKTDISHHAISATPTFDSSESTLSALGIPLLPLTLPRKVDGCMGNIIRRVTGENNESVSASSELEKVVPEFYQARQQPAQPTTAWALVIPRSMIKDTRAKTLALLAKKLARSEKGGEITREQLWERLWQGDPPAFNRLVANALAEGARLHRVLSGGGGWGKKAGLLSLDPVPVSEEVPIRMEDATSAADGPGAFEDALTPVVQDGDAIQFFISPTSHSAGEANGYDELAKLKALPKERTWGWELGTIPSTMDSLPGGSWQHTEAKSEDPAVFKHSFGALSEKGMTVTRHVRVGLNDTDTLATTTVDVPYTRLWYVELEDEHHSPEDVGEPVAA